MFIFNSPVILACPCGDLPYACTAYYADKDSRRLSCGFLVPFLCIAPLSAETWLLNLARLLCFAWEPFSGPQSWSASRQKPSALGGLTSFAFLLWGNTVLNCCCQMSCILSSCPVVYCGRASLEPITVIDKSTSPFWPLEYHFPHYSAIDLIFLRQNIKSNKNKIPKQPQQIFCASKITRQHLRLSSRQYGLSSEGMMTTLEWSRQGPQRRDVKSSKR